MTDDFLDSREFYERMQAYRFAGLNHPQDAVDAFENIKALIRFNFQPRTSASDKVINKSRPAFPCHPDVENPLFDGMTLRDYFAAKAMQTYLAPLGLEGAVKMAYVTADAMLQEREK